MSPRIVRALLRGFAAAGIPGVIAASIAGNDAVAVAFGSGIAVAAFGLILVTAVTTEVRSIDETGEAVEARVAELVARGADPDEVRSLVADAVRFGRQTPPSPS